MNLGFLIRIFSLLFIFIIFANSADRYKNFNAAIYCRAYEVAKMKDQNWLQERFELLQKYIKVNKVYLETHRDLLLVDEKTIRSVQKFFADRSIQTAGGITLTVNEGNRFETFCYSNPEHRKKVKEIVEYTARLFDEVILDDFFFTNCKCELCIAAKGDKSWTDFRLKLMDEASKNIIVGPAKKVNPKVKMVIKYPNWYEHFQGLGFNLETEPKLFDGIYTGTETRDAVLSDQHLQQYLSYLIFRYFENIKPSGNGGGWIDTGGATSLDRYAEQIWLTLFAKAPEITLFDFRQLQRPIELSLRGEWQNLLTSFNFDEMIKPVKQPDGSLSKEATFALAAGYSLDKVDDIIGKLGKPIGLKSYKPYHSTGEDFLHNYLGMIGIPIDLVPEFPAQENLIFLTESAKYDPDIIQKIKHQLTEGKSVIITSGLLRALQYRGIEDIVELQYTDRKASVFNFKTGFEIYQSDTDIIIPQIQYLTNDSWEEVSALDGPIGWPIFHSADYAHGKLYVLIIPDNFADLYNMPVEVLKSIKKTIMNELPIRVDGPAKISLFVYDNSTFIIHSFLDTTSAIRIIANPEVTVLKDLSFNKELFITEKLKSTRFWGRQISENKTAFDTEIKPHSFRVFQVK